MGQTIRHVAVTIALLALLGVSACGEDSHKYEPLDAEERAAVGTYHVDLVHEVTEEQRHDLLSMQMVLRADRTFGWTRWVEETGGRMRTLGTWRVEGGMLITTTTGYYSVDHPGLPHKTLPEPAVEEASYEDGAIRMWAHRPYLLRRVKQ